MYFILITPQVIQRKSHGNNHPKTTKSLINSFIRPSQSRLRMPRIVEWKKSFNRYKEFCWYYWLTFKGSERKFNGIDWRFYHELVWNERHIERKSRRYHRKNPGKSKNYEKERLQYEKSKHQQRFFSSSEEKNQRIKLIRPISHRDSIFSFSFPIYLFPSIIQQVTSCQLLNPLFSRRTGPSWKKECGHLKSLKEKIISKKVNEILNGISIIFSKK